jgi:ribosome-binding protein aMBF1 (putative translation factor)
VAIARSQYWSFLRGSPQPPICHFQKTTSSQPTENREPIVFEIDSLSQLPRVLIQARIATKISQRQLAGQLGIEEGLLQRYEDREYESATLTQLLEVSQVLGISIQQKTTFRVAAPLKTA